MVFAESVLTDSNLDSFSCSTSWFWIRLDVAFIGELLAVIVEMVDGEDETAELEPTGEDFEDPVEADIFEGNPNSSAIEKSDSPPI